MPITVTHSFVSGIADDPAAVAAGTVLPSHWNAQHTVTGVTALIARQTLASAQATVTFSAIPQNFNTLIWTILGADTSAAAPEPVFRLLCNGDTNAANYTVTPQLYSNVGGAGGGTTAPSSAGGVAGMMAGKTYIANSIGTSRGEIVGYSQALYNKIIRAMSAYCYTTGTPAQTIVNTTFCWLSPAAVASITFTAGGVAFQAGSVFSLFGEP